MELTCVFDQDEVYGLLATVNPTSKLQRHDLFAFDERLVIGRALQDTVGHMRARLTTLIRSESYLKAGNIRKSIVMYGYGYEPGDGYAIGYRDEWDVVAGVHVASNQLPYDSFKLVPNRITARKRLKNNDWPTPAYKIGPGEPVRLAPLMEGASRPFVARIRGKKGIYYRKGVELLRARGISIQYFAAFDRVSKPVQDSAKDFFIKRLLHEAKYRLQERFEVQGF